MHRSPASQALAPLRRTRFRIQQPFILSRPRQIGAACIWTFRRSVFSSVSTSAPTLAAGSTSASSSSSALSPVSLSSAAASSSIPASSTSSAFASSSRSSSSNVFQALSERGFIFQHTNGFEDAMNTQRVIYAGFDPTSDCLHLGNLLILLALEHFQRAGHTPVVLIGGATGLVGDPSGRSKERNLIDEESVAKNVLGIRNCLEKFITFQHVKSDAIMQKQPDLSGSTGAALLVNNMDWYGGMNIVTYLREVAKNFRVTEMMRKDSVKNRIDQGDGMSLTEFAYQSLQAYDFKYLNAKYNCSVQIGGSDQWGNIIAGTDLIKRGGDNDIAGDVHGLTVPLLTTAKGEKFGKSAGNAIWLDEAKTSCFQLYQYFLQTDDRDVEKFLLLFTYAPLSEIATVMKQHEEQGRQHRIAQHFLATHVVRKIHGENGVQKATIATKALFGRSPTLSATGDVQPTQAQSLVSSLIPSRSQETSSVSTTSTVNPLASLSRSELLKLFEGATTTRVPREKLLGMSLLDATVLCKAAASKGAARRLIEAGGLYINNMRVENDKLNNNNSHLLLNSDLLGDEVVLIRTGAKKYFIIHT